MRGQAILCQGILGQAILARSLFTALLLMAVASTMLTVPVVAPRLRASEELPGGGVARRQGPQW